VEASSWDSAGLKTTGPLDTVADEAAPPGLSKLAYNERPVPRDGGVGLEEFDMMRGRQNSKRKVGVLKSTLSLIHQATVSITCRRSPLR
jgi:hypothetical protein